MKINKWGPFATAFFLLGFFSFTPYFFGPGLSEPEPIGKFLNGSFENVNTSSEPYRVAFENLTFDSPLNFSPVPNQSKLLVGQRDGKIFWFDDDESTAQKNLILDLSSEVGVIWDGGFLGMVIHPEFGANGTNFLYAFYSTKDAEGNNSPDFATSFRCGLERFYGNYLQLVRFELNPVTMAYVPDSKLTMIRMRLYNSSHRGGGLSFGNDGFLYLTTGDQGAYINSQNIITNLDGGVLRIDVDKDPVKSHPPIRTLSSSGAGETDEFSGIEYWIPNDNPFLDASGGLFEEYFSLGHRAPHRMTLDAQTGLMYIGEIGETRHEEINILSKGKNYGWPVFEGRGPGPVPDCVPNLMDNMPHEEPLVAFPRAEANSVIGGYVYRGNEVPELYGKYICGDFGIANEIWAVDTESGQYELLGNFIPSEIISFGQDSSNELFILKRGENVNLYKLRTKVDYNGIPQKLSETGAFSDLESLSVNEGVLPFELIEPFWSDGALKKRWMAIPNDGTHNTAEEQISFSENGIWEFPAGSVLIKHFDYPIDDNNPSITKKIETRFSVKGDDGNFYFFTYNWNESQTDAFLQEVGLDESIQVTKTDGGSREVIWHYPSVSECIACHNNTTKGTLGTRTRYLNKEFDYSEKGGSIGNQLVTLSALGILDTEINDMDTPNFLTYTSLDDETADINDKARSYLDLNCAYCHQSGTGNRADFDLRLVNSLSQTGLLTAGMNATLGIDGEGILIPGDASKSQLYHRPASINEGIMMPPLAKNQVDSKGVLLIQQWIDQLQAPVPAPELGSYSILNKGNNFVLNVVDGGTSNSDNINVSEFLGLESQYFVLENSFAGYFMLKASHSDKYLDVAAASTANGANVWQYTGNGTDAQLWELVDAGDNTYNIVSKLSGYYLGTQPNGNVVVSANNGSDIFRWELLPANQSGALTLSPVADRSDRVGDEVDFMVSASGGDPSAELVYTLNGAPSGVSIDASTGRVTGTLPNGSEVGAIDGSGTYTVMVTASRSTGAQSSTTFSWTVSTAPTAPVAVYRINAAGPVVSSTDDGPDWSGDMAPGAQSFPGHTVSAGNLSTSTAMAASGRHGSIPDYMDAATYTSLFSSERWDPADEPEMGYTIPLPGGDYVVNVYLGNYYSGADGVGDRIFDILVEGTPAHVDVDPVALFGHLGGGMLSYSVTVSDGFLDVAFVHGASENPLVNAIEVLGGSPEPTELALSPISDRSDSVGDAVDFIVTAS
ncbi:MULTISPECIES: PQQ-dependent sugar dehydrogenase, partial [Maribacter]